MVIAFERAGLIFVFNSHPATSYTDYGIAVDAGKYKPVLCTDEPVYGGFGRIDCSLSYRSQVEPSFGLKHKLQLYLPSRTGIVFRHQEIPRVR